MPIPNSTLHWLYAILKPSYNSPDLAYQDIVLILETFPDLKLKTDVFTHQNGSQDLLLQLYSSPTPSNRVLVNSTNYKLVIHIPLNYPQSPPIVFIQPNVGFILNPNQLLTPNGQLIPKVIQNWGKLYSNDFSNDGIDPRDNRLLDLILSIKSILLKFQLVKKPPPIPSKPTQINKEKFEILSKVQLQLDMNLYSKLTSLTNKVLNNQLNVSDFKNILSNDLIEINQKSEILNTQSSEILIEIEKTENLISKLNSNKEKPMSSLINNKDDYLSNLNANNNSLNDLIKLLESMFFNKKISINQYLSSIRSIGYNQAKILNKINQSL